MSEYLKRLADSLDGHEQSDYAWIITKDYLPSDDQEEATGLTGPYDALPDLLERLAKGEGKTFDLYDDDGERYYRGRLLTNSPTMEEEHCYAPLEDFGQGWAGCTAVRWLGHPEWDCG